MLLGYRLAPGATLHVGDCVEVMQDLPAESVDAIVCDPPYVLSFMGKAWDSEAVAFYPGTWRVALRLLKPGGHLLAFGGTRTFHRLTCGIEDAGFEIRDCLSWLYGSGFPKSLDVSKAIDKAAGAEREVVGKYQPPNGTGWNLAQADGGSDDHAPGTFTASGTRTLDVTAPATDAAREWHGWGTALKPAWEPCVVARKPLVGTVAANVQAHGTGAINVNGCRIPHASADDLAKHAAGVEAIKQRGGTMANSWKNSSDLSGANAVSTQGRWPANVALDEDAAAMLDEQSGERKSAGMYDKGARGIGAKDGPASIPVDGLTSATYADNGGASRFYYVAKASKRDRTAGGTVENTHPTVKPTALMQWLVRLVTPPGGVVLDPFAGSGSTLVAAVREGVRCIGIEREQEYAAIIAGRVAAEAKVPTLFAA